MKKFMLFYIILLVSVSSIFSVEVMLLPEPMIGKYFSFVESNDRGKTKKSVNFELLLSASSTKFKVATMLLDVKAIHQVDNNIVVVFKNSTIMFILTQIKSDVVLVQLIDKDFKEIKRYLCAVRKVAI